MSALQPPEGGEARHERINRWLSRLAMPFEAAGRHYLRLLYWAAAPRYRLWSCLLGFIGSVVGFMIVTGFVGTIIGGWWPAAVIPLLGMMLAFWAGMCSEYKKFRRRWD